MRVRARARARARVRARARIRVRIGHLFLSGDGAQARRAGGGARAHRGLRGAACEVRRGEQRRRRRPLASLALRHLRIGLVR